MRCGRSATTPTSIRSGTIRPVPGRRTTASASITCCCHRRPPTGWPARASTGTCAAGTSPPITCPFISIWILKDASLLAPRLEPAPQIDRRERAFVFVRLLHGAVVKLGDPGLVGARAVFRKRQPHQAARRLPRHVIALEQHRAEHGLCLALALLRR